jgi:hypothetical protein
VIGPLKKRKQGWIQKGEGSRGSGFSFFVDPKLSLKKIKNIRIENITE